MIVVSDSTPIISFAKLGMLDVLDKFYDEVLLPKAVINEVCRNPIFEAEASAVQTCIYIKVKVVNNTQAVRKLMATGFDIGESEAIVLAETMPESLLLMDERKGRQIAIKMGVRVIGTLGILLQAKKVGYIKHIAYAAQFERVRRHWLNT